MRGLALANNVDSWVPRNGHLRTRSGPEGSSRKQTRSCVGGVPDSSWDQGCRPDRMYREQVHGSYITGLSGCAKNDSYRSGAGRIFCYIAFEGDNACFVAARVRV